MAIRANLATSSVGVGFNDAYVRVLQFRGDKEKVYVTVGAYATEAARQAGSATVGSSEYQINPADLQGDFLPSVYNWLKLQPEFADAVDC